MVFSSSVFLLLFLPAVFVINCLIREQYSNYFLLFASLFFYAWGEPFFVLVMAASILINWFCGNRIDRSDGFAKKLWLFLAVAADLSLLGYYKYSGLFISTLNSVFGRWILPPRNVALPIGISFFTFQAISYVVDVYRGETKASPKLVNTALYISFFPQLIAGPIVKYRDINRQIEHRSVTRRRTAEGFRRFIYGLAKKVLISNVLGLCVDTVWQHHISVIDPAAAWIGALAYAFQIYYDFSGYSDMAIGLGKMFGFDFLENFDYPYLSASVSEFWRRWHISLGSWFREYLYIPLGGNRKGRLRTYLNLCVVFLLTGLWHGANFSFVLWGAYHGFFSIVERLGFKNLLKKSRVAGTVYCFLVVTLGWVLFRSNDILSGLRYLSRMLRPWHYHMAPIPSWQYLDNKTVVMLAFAVIGAGLLKRFTPESLRARWKDSLPEAVFCVALLILSIASIASDTYNPFIYFQF